MKLIIDIGNTRVKIAIFDGNELKDYNAISVAMLRDELNKIITKESVKNIVVSSVIKELPECIKRLQAQFNLLVFDANTPVPLKNLYKTTHTLGSDRLAAAVGANHLYPKNDILVIDVGTCIKYNFTNLKGEYLGGAISPGIQMRFKAMHTFTGRLPLVEKDDDYMQLIGATTEDSLLSGVMIGVLAEVNGIMDVYQKQYPQVKFVFTGGDVPFFEKRLKNSIFVEPFLVLKGLNVILDYNVRN